MLPMNEPRLDLGARREERGAELGPALFGGWIGGSVLGALALWNGLGWLAALAAYSLGGSLLVLSFAVLPLLEFRLLQPVLHPAFVRVRRQL